MKQYFSMLPILALSVAGMFAPNLKASEWDRKTNITIDHAIEVQGTVLSAGSYVIKLVDSPSERYLVRILNAEENSCYRDRVRNADQSVSTGRQQRVHALRIRKQADARTSHLVFPWRPD
jgi:hypothetical protein